MAKLIDILARELKVWPESWGIFCVAGRFSGSNAAWFCAHNPVYKDGGWNNVGSVELWLSQEPEDRKEVVVRRFEWQAAVDALNAPKVVDGLPAIGSRVFVYDPEGVLRYGQGEDGEVVAHVENTAVVRMSYGLGCFEARCLRTAEQLAAEEREKAIFDIAHILIDNRHDSAEYHQAGRIYDAGYRKQ